MAHTARLLCLVGFLPYVFAIIISAQMMMRSVDHYCPALFFFFADFIFILINSPPPLISKEIWKSCNFVS
jgi:hypothetical protein